MGKVFQNTVDSHKVVRKHAIVLLTSGPIPSLFLQLVGKLTNLIPDLTVFLE
ncbi:hypothetical protein SCYAM73S_02242 [Streptomyces cyaneofuscatus]